jgi:hypothetical protein
MLKMKLQEARDIKHAREAAHVSKAKAIAHQNSCKANLAVAARYKNDKVLIRNLQKELLAARERTKKASADCKAHDKKVKVVTKKVKAV